MNTSITNAKEWLRKHNNKPTSIEFQTLIRKMLQQKMQMCETINGIEAIEFIEEQIGTLILAFRKLYKSGSLLG
jgi:hypothetical protein